MIDDVDKECKHMEWYYKQWLDRYPIHVESKGGMNMINPELVIITSQYSIEQIWEDKETRDAISRRCDDVSVPSLSQLVLPERALAHGTERWHTDKKEVDYCGRVRWEKIHY